MSLRVPPLSTVRTDAQVTPHPPTMRGLLHTAEKLRAAGHAVVEWQGSFRVTETLKLIVVLWGADGGETSQNSLLH
jgi:amidase